MAVALVVVVSALLYARAWATGPVRTSMQEVDSRTHLTCQLNDSSVEITGHRWVRGNKVLLEDNQPGLKMEYYMNSDDHSGIYSCIFLPETVGRGDILVSGPPKVKTTKKLETGDEGDGAVLRCWAEAEPPVLHWKWFRLNESGDQQPIDNLTRADKYFVVIRESSSELHVKSLHVEQDPGKYSCQASNDQGQDSEVIVLRVRKHLAALWPFLGIVAEVLVLVTIIFIYEKRQKKGENLDDEDTGSQPLKTTGQLMNDQSKELSVRQRNSS